MKYAITGFLFLALAGCAATAQSYKIYNLYAYGRQFIPGNIPVEEGADDKPARHTFIYTVYIETNSSQLPQITAAWIDKVSHHATPFAIPDNTVVAGKDQKNGRPVTIRPAKGRWLYKVEFHPPDTARKLPAGYQNTSVGKILLQMRVNKKTEYMLTRPIAMLEPEEMY